MTWLFLPILIAAAAAAYVGGRALANRRGLALPTGERPHSRPGQHGIYALIWTAVPALIVLIAASAFAPGIEQLLTASGAPVAVQQLEPGRHARREGCVGVRAVRIAVQLAHGLGPAGQGIEDSALRFTNLIEHGDGSD